MTKAQLSAALKLALNGQELPVDRDHAMSIFMGFGLPDFQPTVCTLPQLAYLIRWQALQFNGHIDADALNEIAEAGRRKFMVV